MKLNLQGSPKEEENRRISTSEQEEHDSQEVLDITDMDSVRKAFVLSEIINRKY